MKFMAVLNERIQRVTTLFEKWPAFIDRGRMGDANVTIHNEMTMRLLMRSQQNKKRYLSWIIVSKQLLLKKIFCLTMLIAVKCWMIKARYMIWTMLTTFSRLCNLFWRDPWSSCHACPFGNDITNHLLKDLSTLIVLTFHPWTCVCLSRAKLHPLMAASKSHAVNFRLPGTAGGPVCESVSVS